MLQSNELINVVVSVLDGGGWAVEGLLLLCALMVPQRIAGRMICGVECEFGSTCGYYAYR